MAHSRAKPLLWLALLALTTFGGGQPSASSTPATVPASFADGPIAYQRIVRANPPLRMHAVSVDLTDPRIEVRACPGGPDPDGDGPWQTTLHTVREIAAREHLDVAVNGNFFVPKDAREIFGRRNPYFPGNWAQAVGWAAADGHVWSRLDGGEANLVIYDDGRVTLGRFRPELPPGASHVISGMDLILVNGKPINDTKDQAPRTCVGLDRQGKRLVILVVDGRRNDWSVGLTKQQLGEQMRALGCWHALNLDGGGSSTLVMRDRDGSNELALINRPSDGHDLPISMSFERSVAWALGVRLRETKN